MARPVRKGTDMRAIFILLLLMTACRNQVPTNNEIIAETMKCREAGLKAVLIQNGVTMEPVRLVCVPE